MIELRPCLITAPITIENADKLDTNTIYVFDYENSFKDSTNKPEDFINYLETLGCMIDVFVSDDTSFEEREQLLLKYLNAKTFFNAYTLSSTLISILFKYRGIDNLPDRHSIFTKEEITKFINRNSSYLKSLELFFNSIFLLMLMLASDPKQQIVQIKRKYPEDIFKDDSFGANVCNVLIDKDFYRYYTKHIGNDVYYYPNMFDYNLYNGRSILDIIKNKNNTLLPVIIDLNSEKFQKFLSSKIV